MHKKNHINLVRIKHVFYYGYYYDLTELGSWVIIRQVYGKLLAETHSKTHIGITR